jgi:putative hemolysin
VSDKLPMLLLAVCVAVSFLLSGMEAGFFALNRLRIRQLMRKGQPRARLLCSYLEHPENFLWTILTGNTLANFLGVAITVSLLFNRLGHWPWLFVGAFALSVFLFYTWCELLPKMLFRLYPNRLSLVMVVPFRFVHVALAPLVEGLTRLSHLLLRWSGGKFFTDHLFGNRDELRLLMQESSQQVLTSDERAMINRVLDVQNLNVGQITTPMGKAVTVSAETPMLDVLNLSREHGYTRLPVWKDGAGQRRVAGVLSLKSLLYQSEFDPKRKAGDYLKPALFLESEMRLDTVLRRMQRGGLRLAIVLGRDKKELGIVTLEDVLKAMFGEVRL